jgi:hypothetical protein
MRQLAINYVDSPLFSVRSREEFLQLTRSGLRVAGALSIWVLQHCQTPSVDIEIIGNALRPGARLFVVNNTHRAVPVEERHWVNDGIDVRAALDTELTCTDAGTFSAEEIGEVLAPSTFWATYEAKQRE